LRRATRNREWAGSESTHATLARTRGASYEWDMAKGIEKGKKNNKPKLSTKEKQKKKKEKQARK
jgi:hypothetical protein